MSRPFDFEEYGGLESRQLAQPGHVKRPALVVQIELHLLLEPVAWYIALHFLHHGLNAVADGVLVSWFGQREDRVAHDERRLGRIQDDDGLATGGTAQNLNGFGCGFCKFVDVGARTRACRTT